MNLKFYCRAGSLCVLLFFSIFPLKAIDHAPISVYRPEVEKMIDSLENKFGKRKNVTEEFRLAFYYAISYYPELINTRIIFREKKLATTMAARPTALSIIRTRKHRTYCIYINSNENHPSPVLSEFTFNAQIGIIGHELAHILHYRDERSKHVLHEAINYRKENFKSHFERETDSMTIARGLGWQLYDFTSQLHALKSVPEEYKKYKIKMYMTPAQIFSMMGDFGYER
jgi:hypothetical protein